MLDIDFSYYVLTIWTNIMVILVFDSFFTGFSGFVWFACVPTVIALSVDLTTSILFPTVFKTKWRLDNSLRNNSFHDGWVRAIFNITLWIVCWGAGLYYFGLLETDKAQTRVLHCITGNYIRDLVGKFIFDAFVFRNLHLVFHASSWYSWHKAHHYDIEITVLSGFKIDLVDFLLEDNVLVASCIALLVGKLPLDVGKVIWGGSAAHSANPYLVFEPLNLFYDVNMFHCIHHLDQQAATSWSIIPWFEQFTVYKETIAKFEKAFGPGYSRLDRVWIMVFSMVTANMIHVMAE